MAITTEFLTGLGIEKDVAEKIFAERGKEITAEKEKAEKTAAELKEAKDTITQITGELNGLKANNASAEEWQKKFEDLKRENDEKERIAKEQAVAAEREANLKARYEAANVDKNGKYRKWNHEAIKNDYFAKFTAAVDDAANAGRSDIDILNELVQNDPMAFEGVQRVTLAGAKPISFNGVSREDFKKMNYSERLQFKTEQPELYKAITENKE